MRVRFELSNDPACFQRALDLILTKYKWKTCLVYLGDIISFSRKVADYVTYVAQITTTPADAGVTLKINKWHFFNAKLNTWGT